MSEENWDDDGETTLQQSDSNRHYSGQSTGNRKSYEDRGNSDRNNWGNYNEKRRDNRDNYRKQDDNRYRRDDWRNGERRNDNERNQGRTDNRSSSTMEIDPSKVGAVIGRGGSTIREIQSNYNVHVKVDRDRGMNGLCSVFIKGEQSDIDRAKKHIEDLLAESVNVFETAERRPPSPVKTDENESFQLIDWRAAYVESEKNQLKQWENYPDVVKNFYVEDPKIANMSPVEVAAFREANNNITVNRAFKDKPLGDVPIPNPIYRFEQCFDNFPEILHEIKKQGFEKPSPIQCQAWPVLLKGEDMIGIAQTGTGKTLAFLLPAMIHTEFQKAPRNERTGPTVLVMAPTRELAIQIEKEVGKYQYRMMKAVCLYGGGDRKAQVSTVEKGVEIVIATPGRLNDLVQAKVLDLMNVSYVVLDEADRMLDMGFEPQIRKILMLIRPDKQTVMTSATWPPGVRRLAEKYMINPVQVCIGSLDLAAVHSVTQIIEIMDEDEKFYRVMAFAKNMSSTDKAIVFCGKKARADDLSSEMSLKGLNVQCIHGDRDQADREQALADIKSGLATILIATDVASRGIDIEDISHVVNYDFPRNIEEYVHRVGRTGRAGRTGTSISYVTRSDWASAGELIVILEEADQDVPQELYNMKERFEAKKKSGGFFRNTGMKFGGGEDYGGSGGYSGGGRSGGGGGRSGGGGGGGGRFGGGRRW